MNDPVDTAALEQAITATARAQPGTFSGAVGEGKLLDERRKALDQEADLLDQHISDLTEQRSGIDTEIARLRKLQRQTKRASSVHARAMAEMQILLRDDDEPPAGSDDDKQQQISKAKAKEAAE